jgi:alcohol oxidase
MDVQNNLYLRCNARVSRVIFEGNKAVGVAYVPSRSRTNGAAVEETIVRIRKDDLDGRLTLTCRFAPVAVSF